MRRRVQQGVCWLMLAVLLFTGGMPVVIRHAHAVDHDRDLERHHPEDYLALAPAARWQPETPQDGAEHDPGCLLPVAAHVHLFVFGLEFTFEAGSRRGGGDESNGSAPKSSMLARLIEADRLHLQAADDSDSVPVADRAAVPASASPGFAQQPPRRFIFPPLISRPLCDSARHERSGVQLI